MSWSNSRPSLPTPFKVAQNISLPPLSTWSEQYQTRSSASSSPPRSSSPLMTPLHQHRTHNVAHILSSPTFAGNPEYSLTSSHIRDPFQPRDDATNHFPTKQPFALPSLNSIFLMDDASSSFSDYDLAYDSEIKRSPSTAPYSRQSVEDSDSDIESIGQDDPFAFSVRDVRATYFRTSAERGQWRNAPAPYQPISKPLVRQSEPTTTAEEKASLNQRPISAPAPVVLPTFGKKSFHLEEQSSYPSHIPKASSPPIEEPNVPSVVGEDGVRDEADSAEYDELPCPSSPFPLIPRSLSSSPMRAASASMSAVSPCHDQEPSSPQSLPPSSPPFRHSSPDLEQALMGNALEPDPEHDSCEITVDILPPRLSPAIRPVAIDEDLTPSLVEFACSSDHVANPFSPEESHSSPLQLDLKALPLDEPSTLEHQTKLDDDSIAASTTKQMDFEIPSIVQTAGDGVLSPAIQPVISGDYASSSDKALTQKDENGVAPGHDASVKELKASLKPITNKRKKEQQPTRGPVRKKARISTLTDDGSGPSRSRVPKLKKADKVALKAADKLESTTNGQNVNPGLDPPRVSTPSPRSRSMSPLSPISSCCVTPRANRVDTSALDEEVCGMLIESMATSRASSLPISALYRSLMQSRPSLKEQRGEQEWMELFARVLENGQSDRGSGVFGKVESSGKDNSNRPLEAQWFYVPELDENQERATLIRSMMPRPGKRSETKKYKQYYYRPLAKISRWDPEDEI